MLAAAIIMAVATVVLAWVAVAQIEASEVQMLGARAHADAAIAIAKDQAAAALADWSGDLTYWSRFENLLGERFEVRNHADPTRPSEFRRLT